MTDPCCSLSINNKHLFPQHQQKQVDKAIQVSIISDIGLQSKAKRNLILTLEKCNSNSGSFTEVVSLNDDVFIPQKSSDKVSSCSLSEFITSAPEIIVTSPRTIMGDEFHSIKRAFVRIISGTGEILSIIVCLSYCDR